MYNGELIGTWVCEDDFARRELKFSSDETYTYTVKCYENYPDTNGSGEWKIDGTDIKCTSSNNGDNGCGTYHYKNDKIYIGGLEYTKQ